MSGEKVGFRDRHISAVDTVRAASITAQKLTLRDTQIESVQPPLPFNPPQALNSESNGIIDTSTYSTLITVQAIGGLDGNYEVSDGTEIGQLKLVRVEADDGSTAATQTLTPINVVGGLSVTLDTDGSDRDKHRAVALLAWSGSGWALIDAVNAVVV
jgi:hypothetical protein